MSEGGVPPPVDHNILKPSTLRAWRVATGVAMGLTAFQLIFRTDYGERDHVFMPIQRWYAEQLDAWLGVDSEVARRLKAPTLSLAAHQKERERRELEQAQKARDVAAALRLAQGPAVAAMAPAPAQAEAWPAAPAAQAGGSGGGGWVPKWLKFW